MSLKTKIILIKLSLMNIAKKLMTFKGGLILFTKDHTDILQKLWRN